MSKIPFPDIDNLICVMKIVKRFNGEDIKFISDLHYNHKGILKFGYSSRPWESVDDMNSGLIASLQSGLKKSDVLFDLGDMFWKVKDLTAIGILKQLPCSEIYKLLGNHDSYTLWRTPMMKNLCSAIGDLMEIIVDYEGEEYRLVLSHYPLLSWNHKTRGSIMLHGHCHGTMDPINSDLLSDLRLDVGMDASLSRSLGSPIVSFSDVIKNLKEKTGGVDFKTWSKLNYKNTI